MLCRDPGYFLLPFRSKGEVFVITFSCVRIIKTPVDSIIGNHQVKHSTGEDFTLGRFYLLNRYFSLNNIVMAGCRKMFVFKSRAAKIRKLHINNLIMLFDK